MQRQMRQAETRRLGEVHTPQRLADAPGFIARRTYQSYVDLWQDAVSSGLTGPQYAVLSVLDSFPGSEQRHVADAADVDPSTMAGIARRLERQHLIIRVPSLVDRRVKHLQLTSLGKEVLENARAQADRLDDRLFAMFPEHRAAELKDALHDLADAWTRLAAETAGVRS